MSFQRLALASLLGAASASPLSTRQASTVTVDLSERFQTIDGFGFSEAFQRANGILELPEPKRSEVVDLLFNATSGAGFTILRNGIGSSANSNLDWMNTFLPVGPDTPDGEPEYVWDGKDSGQLWVAQQGVKYGVKTFYANAWSAPGFMKSNGVDSNGGGLCGSPGVTCESGDWRQAYANYLTKLIQLYAEEGVEITHLGFLNEPDITTGYASMRMDGAQAADFIKVLHPTLEDAGLGHVEIACCDATGWEIQKEYTQALGEVGDMVGVVTSHIYTSPFSGTQPTDSKVWESEISDLSGSWSTDWYSRSGASGDGYTWANTIYNGLTQSNISAFIWWEGTQDRATNNNNNEKLILVDGDEYEVSKRLWAHAQYSRTVRPGAVRVGVSGGTNMKITAFENEDGRVAINVINSGQDAATFAIGGIMATSATAWVTDNDHDMDETDVVVEDGEISGVTVPATGMVSIVIEPQ